MTDPKGPLMTRRRFMTYSGLLAGAVATGAWGYTEPRYVEQTYHQIKTERLDDVVRIIHISDLHMDDDRSRDYVPKMVSNCNADLVIMTGDYLNHTRENPVPVERLEEYVNNMSARKGIYAVFGNWDMGLEKQLFADTDVIPLRDESVQFSIGGSVLNLTGISYLNERHSPRTAAHAPIADYDIVMTHTPDYINELSEQGDTDLLLCGHTHGGQIRIPFLRLLQDGKGDFPYAGSPMVGLIRKNAVRYQAGMYDVGGMQAYVNRGIGMCGMDGVPKMRILCRPEVALFDIGPAEKLPKITELPWYQS